MTFPRDAMLLRVFIGEDAKFQRHPLYEAIVLKARELHLAGATVLRGPMGFGPSNRLHTWKILRLSEDLPLVIEIVDTEERIKELTTDARCDDAKRARHSRKSASVAIRRRGQARARVKSDLVGPAPTGRSTIFASERRSCPGPVSEAAVDASHQDEALERGHYHTPATPSGRGKR